MIGLPQTKASFTGFQLTAKQSISYLIDVIFGFENRYQIEIMCTKLIVFNANSRKGTGCSSGNNVIHLNIPLLTTKEVENVIVFRVHCSKRCLIWQQLNKAIIKK